MAPWCCAKCLCTKVQTFSQIHKYVSTIASTLSIVEIVRNDWFLEKLVVQVLTTTFSSINWFVIIKKKAIRSRIVMDLLESVDPFQLSHINENLDVLDLLQ